MRTVIESIHEEEIETFRSLEDYEENESKDDYTREKLKKLLYEQAKKNENLNDKKIRLLAQQKSLLQLLQKKDNQIKETIASITKIEKIQKNKKNFFKKIKNVPKRIMLNVFQFIECEYLAKKIKENQTSEMKCKHFIKKFTVLNVICIIKCKIDNLNIRKCFEKLKFDSKLVRNPLFLISCLKNILKKRFVLLFLYKPSDNLFAILQRKQKSLMNYGFFEILYISNLNNFKIINQNLQELENNALSQENILKSNQMTISITKTNYNNLKVSLNNEKTEQESLKATLAYKESQCIDTQRKISLQIEEINKYKAEIENQQSLITNKSEKILEEIENNNIKIEEIEGSIDYYCSEISQKENEGRSSALQYTQLQASYKKAQDLYNSLVTEKKKFQAIENDNKKQKIVISSKIDALAEEKETLLGRYNNNAEDIQLLSDQILEKEQELNSLQEMLHELKTREDALINHRNRLKQDLDEECDLKSSLLSHKQNELAKIKESLEFNKKQRDLLIKELNSALKKEENERILKNSAECTQLTKKLEETSKEIQAENSKNIFLVNQSQKLSSEKQKLQEEYKSLNELYSNISEENALLSKKILSLENEKRNSICDTPDSTTESLKQYTINLEQKVKELTAEISASPDISKYTKEKTILENKIKTLEFQLNECNEFAIKSRKDVAEAIAEIEHYANILVVMEEKMNETEEKLLYSNREKEETFEELKNVRQQYYNAISGANK